MYNCIYKIVTDISNILDIAFQAIMVIAAEL